MTPLDQPDDPLLSSALTDRAAAEAVEGPFGATMLDAVRRGARRRRTRRRLALGGTAAVAASALAFTLLPGIGTAGSPENPAAPAVTGSGTAGPTMPTSDIGDAPLERFVLSLPVGPMPPAPAAARVQHEGETWSLRLASGATVALPEDTTFAEIVADDAHGVVLQGEKGSESSATPQGYVFSVAPGSTRGTVLATEVAGGGAVISPDGTRVALPGSSTLGGVRTTVDRRTGQPTRGTDVRTFCPEESAMPQAWTTAGVLWECIASTPTETATVQLRSPDTDALISTWTVPRHPGAWLHGRDPEAVLRWDHITATLTRLDPRTGASISSLRLDAQAGAVEGETPAGTYAGSVPALSPDGRRVALGDRVVDARTLRVTAAVHAPAREMDWTWRGNDWLISNVHIRRYLGPNGEELPTGERRDDHFYQVVCRADGTECHRVAGDPYQSPTT